MELWAENTRPQYCFTLFFSAICPKNGEFCAYYLMAHQILVSAPGPFELILTGFDWVGTGPWRFGFGERAWQYIYRSLFIKKDDNYYKHLSLIKQIKEKEVKIKSQTIYKLFANGNNCISKTQEWKPKEESKGAPEVTKKGGGWIK